MIRAGHIVINDPSHGRAIANRAEIGFDLVRDVVIANVDRDYVLKGGVLYTRFSDASCEMHVAGFRPRWASRDLLWVAFDYPFMQLSLERVFTSINTRNIQALLLAKHLGFKRVCVIPAVHSGGAGQAVFVLEFADCRWLKIRPRRITVGV